jgi:hypothetical protein
LIYFVTFVPIEDVKIVAVDIKIDKNYIKMHQNWDRKHSVVHLDPLDILDVEERQNYIQMHQSCDPNILVLYTLTHSTFWMYKKIEKYILDVEKDKKNTARCISFIRNWEKNTLSLSSSWM